MFSNIHIFFQSQRAVKSRLQVMEKEALKKQEKRKEANVKFEKQQLKDRDKLLKAKQRKEVYYYIFYLLYFYFNGLYAMNIFTLEKNVCLDGDSNIVLAFPTIPIELPVWR